jgi:hypothetical protein
MSRKLLRKRRVLDYRVLPKKAPRKAQQCFSFLDAIKKAMKVNALTKNVSSFVRFLFSTHIKNQISSNFPKVPTWSTGPIVNKKNYNSNNNENNTKNFYKLFVFVFP